MINYREIFNINYSIIGLIMILIIISLIILINKNIGKSCNILGKVFISSSFISLFLLFIMNFGLKVIIPHQYTILVEVISKSLEKNYLIYSIIVLVFGLLLLIFSNLKEKK